MHLLSETAKWITESEFVSPDGRVSKATGETEIVTDKQEVRNNSWAMLDNVKRINNYTIVPVTHTEYRFESLNPELGIQRGEFNVDRNTIYSKFTIGGTNLNGFEIIKRQDDICYANGVLYDGEKLINSWNAVMMKMR